MSQVVFAQKFECNEMLKRCILIVENQYKEDNEICMLPEISEPLCAVMYKFESAKFMECVNEKVQECREENRRMYLEGIDFCNQSYKKCRRGDVFGIINMAISYERKISTEFTTGNASFSIIGFWKYRPDESYSGVKNYRPDNLQMLGRLNERTIEDNPQKCTPPYK